MFRSPSGGTQTHSLLQGRLLISVSIAAVITVAEFVGGILSNSLALLGDAGHVGSDAFSLALAFFAMRLATRPHTSTSTYGYHRAEVLAALTNGVTLFLISGYIFYEAYARFLNPPEVRGPLLLTVAAIGLAANLVMVFLLRHGRAVSINVRGAFLHVVGDTLGSVAVIVGGVSVITAGLFIVDPIAAVLIAALMLRGGVSLVRESLRFLLEQVPKGVKVEDVVEEIRRVNGVKSVHDVHIWALTTDKNFLTAHVEVTEHHRGHEVRAAIDRVLREKFNITHTTVQVEIHTEARHLVKIDTGKETSPQSG